MIFLRKLPAEIISMILDNLDDQDVFRFCLTHPEIPRALWPSARLHVAQQIYHTVWQIDGLEQANHEAAACLFDIVLQKSAAQANTRLDIEGPLHAPPKFVGGEAVAYGQETTRYTCTLLHLACYSGLDNIVELLLARGADKDADIHQKSILDDGDDDRTGRTGIEIAASRHHVHIMTRLAQAGAHMDPRCIRWAIHYNSLPMLELLVRFQQQARGDSPPEEWLAYAACCRKDQLDRTRLVEYIVTERTDAVTAADDKSFLFKSALDSRAFPMALVLARNGFATTVDDVQEVCGRLPAIEKEEHELLEILRYLLEKLELQGTQEKYLMNHPLRRRRKERWDSKLREVMWAYWNNTMNGSRLAIIE